jgi:translation initiation factor IF-2
VIGSTYGRIRSLTDDLGNRISSAGPSKPVIITGLKDVPSFGERIEVVPNEKLARSMTQADSKSKKHIIKDGAKTYKVILKADVGGSLAALESSLSKLGYKDATVEVLSSGIGQVNENDINLAKTSGATIISFRSSPAKRIAEIAQKEGVVIKEYWVIYEAIEFLNDQLRQIATPVLITEEVARLKVLAIFSQKNNSAIVGGEVTQGLLVLNTDVKIWRDKEEIGTAKLKEIKIGKLAVERVEAGNQCGVLLEGVSDIAEGDILVFTITREE